MKTSVKIRCTLAATLALLVVAGYTPYIPFSEYLPDMSVTAYADTVDLVVYDFESESSYSDWTFIDADGDGSNWVLGNPSNWYICSAHSGEMIFSSWSWNNMTLDPDNWAITPAITVNTNGKTYFNMWACTNPYYRQPRKTERILKF